MAAASLEAEVRTQLGKRHMRRLREAGRVPAVLCERGKPSVSLTVGATAMRHALAGGAHLVDLKLSGQMHKVLVKDVQLDPLAEHIYHVDFLKVSLTEKVQVKVVVVLKGKPVGVSEEGGQLMQHAHELEVSCLPTAIPDSLTVDVSAIKLNDVLHASAVHLPAGVTLVTDKDAAVCAVVPPRAEEVAAPAAEVVPTTVEPELIRKERKVEEGEEVAAEKPKEKPKEKAKE